MSEFTKGEWKIIGKSEMDGVEIGIDNNDGTKCPLANVKWYGEDDCNAEEDMANAFLIASAPTLKQQRDDLLKACRRMTVSLECLRIHGFPKCSKEDMCCICNAKAAIAKCEA